MHEGRGRSVVGQGGAGQYATRGAGLAMFECVCRAVGRHIPHPAPSVCPRVDHEHAWIIQRAGELTGSGQVAELEQGAGALGRC